MATTISYISGSTVFTSTDYTSASSPPNVILGSGWTNIDTNTFLSNTDLSSIIIPNTMTSIGNTAFKLCASLTTVTFETGSVLETIGNGCFNSSAITSIIIPNTVTSIGTAAFISCASLTTVTFETGSVLETIGHSCFNDTAITSIIIPNTVTSIGNTAFKLCASLTTVTFETGSVLKTIGNVCFKDSDITSIIIPNTVTSIGTSAFISCASLTTVTFETGSVLETIGNSCFNGTAITSIIIPNTMTSIGNNAFINTTNLTSVTIASFTIAYVNYKDPTLGLSATTGTVDTFFGSGAITSYTVVNGDISVTIMDTLNEYNFIDTGKDTYLMICASELRHIDIQSNSLDEFDNFTFHDGNNENASAITPMVDDNGIFHIRTSQESLYVTLSVLTPRPTWNLEIQVLSNNGYIITQLGDDIDGEASGDQSGYSVSLSSDGSIVAIGALYNDGNSSYLGHTRVYQYTDSSWVQLGADIDGEAANDYSGHSVSLSADGSIVAIGANYNDGNGSNSGHTRVYQYTDSSWVQLGADIDGEAAGDLSGYSVSLSSDGTIVAIGAPYNSSYSGHTRVYQYTDSSWVQLGADIDGEAANDYSGHSVSLSADGSIVAIGANYNDGNGSNSGHVRVYKNISDTWTKIGDDIDGEAADDLSGYSVSLSSDGTIVAICAKHNDGNGSNSGHVRVYKNISDTWTKIGDDIDGEAANDYSGDSVSLSADGSIVAIGTKSNGASSGHVQVYKNISDNWTKIGDDIDGEAAGDLSGYSVSLSSDGTIVAIGAPYNDGNGANSGHVRVLEFAEIPQLSAISSSPICFPAGTPVTTDQGVIAIEKINPNINTIRGKKIVAITKSTPMQNHIISIKKDAFAKNIPSAPTQISKEHKLLYKGKMVKARDLVGVCKGASKTPYNGEILYNVLLKKHDKMMINNLICETLDPENIVAKIINRKLKQSDVNKLYAKLNSIMITNDIPAYKKLHAVLN